MDLISDGESRHEQLEPVTFDRDKVKSLETLKELGFVAYSLGPIYVYSGVHESIPERFAAECDIPDRPDKVRGASLDFKHYVLARCELYNKRLEIMDSVAYPFFQSWMLAQMFVNRDQKNVYVPKRYLCPVLDPLAYEAGSKVPASIDVYTTSSMRSLLRPVCEAHAGNVNSLIDFERRDPEESVVTDGKKILQVMGIQP